MCAFKYFTKIDIVKLVKASGGLLSECSVGDPRAKTTEVEARVALVCASTDDGRPLTGGTNLIWTVVDWVASGSGPMHKRQSQTPEIWCKA